MGYLLAKKHLAWNHFLATVVSQIGYCCPKEMSRVLNLHYGLLLVMAHMITLSLLKSMVTMVVLMLTVESMVKNIQIFVPWAIHLIVRSLIHVLLKISQTTNLHMSRFTTRIISLC